MARRRWFFYIFYKGAFKSYCEEKKIRYLRKICNVGANPNILEGFLYCDEADYLWILGDDDILQKGSVEKIIKILECNNGIDLLFLSVADKNGSVVILNQKELMINPSEYGFGLISLVIFRSEFVAPFIRAGYDNLLSCFPHLAILFEAIKAKKSAKVFSIPRKDFFTFEKIGGKAEPTAYLHSFYGYTLLSNNLEEEPAKKLLWDWWKMHSVKAIRNADLAPIHSTACFAMMKKHIPVRFFLSKFLPRNLFAILHLPLHKLDRKQIKLFQFKRDK